jgi:HlyD family secretion protein
MRGKWLLFGGVIILVAVAAGAIQFWLRQRSSAAPAPVKTEPQIYQGNEVSLQGKIRPQKLVAVPSPADGVVEEYFVDVGEEVYADQLLGRVKSGRLDAAQDVAQLELEKVQSKVNDLDSTLVATRLEASRTEAEAGRLRSEYERAEKIYQRQQMLLREGATPRNQAEKAEKEYQQLKTDYASADALAKAAATRATALQAELDNARKALREKQDDVDDAKQAVASGEIHSPVDGIVMVRKLQAGEQVSKAEKELFQIATELGSLEVVLEPPPPVLARIKAGQQAGIRVAELADQELPASVKAVEGTQVIVEFVSPLPSIKPGLTAQVRIALGELPAPAPATAAPAAPKK